MITLPKDQSIKTGRYLIHKVKSGETLMALYRRYKKTPKQIQKLNGLKNTNIYIEQKLKIPIHVCDAVIKVKNDFFSFSIKDNELITLYKGIWKLKAITHDGLKSDWTEVEIVAGKKITIMLELFK